MQIGQKFSIAIHILLSCEFFKDEKNTSAFLAETIGTNPVIIRQIVALLKSANLLEVTAGTGGANLARQPKQINLLDVYKAVSSSERNLFKIHENSPQLCPLGGKIEKLLAPKFKAVQTAFENELARVNLQLLLDELKAKGS